MHNAYVMQSDRNSFWGDVVLDSINMASGEEDSMLDQIHEEQIYLIFIMEVFFLLSDV